MAEAEAGMDRILEKVRQESSVEVLRGLEGKAADVYFSVFDELILDRNSPFRFSGRNRRPPLDMVNALLSYAYTMILHEAIAGLESVGLDPAVGFLHKDRPGRQSLALDLAEEFRPYFGDRLVLSLINNKRLVPSDFRTHANGAVLLTEDGRKKFLTGWQQRKQEELEHPFLKEKMAAGLLFFVQSRLLAKYIRGEMDYYLPFVWK
jgi:CRISPR-associated protein Cas1